MAQVLALALPFFGLIFLGFFCGRIRKLPEEGLAWMNFFIVYVALPCLFFKLIATTPFEQLSNWPFILSTMVSTYIAFALSFAVGIWITGGDIKSAAIQGALGGYSNVGYMGPGITLAAIGPAAAVPTALVFVFDCILFFTIVPFMMGLGGAEKMKIWSTTKYVVLKVVTHPFNIATAIAVLAAYLPAALSAEELTALVKEAIAETGASLGTPGGVGKAQMGAVMKAAQAKAAGRADGKSLSAEVQKQLP